MTKEDKIYKVLNDSKIDLTEYEEPDLSTEEKNRLFQTFQAEIKPREQRKSSKNWLAMAAALLLLIAGNQTTLGQHVQATAASIIENIRYSLNSALGNESSETPGALSFNQTAQIGSAEVSIKDLIVFEHRIVFNLLVDMNGDIQDEHFLDFDDKVIKINGHPLNSISWSSRGSVYDKEENIHSRIYSIRLDEPISEDDLIHIAIHFDGIHHYQPGKTNEEQLLIDGEATFSAETTMKDLNRYTDIYDIQRIVKQNDYEYVVEKMYINPILNFIEVYSENLEVLGSDFQLMEFRGKDENGREVLFEHTYLTESEDFRKYSFSLNEEASEISTEQLVDVGYLELELYLADWPEEQGAYVELEPYGEPFIIDLTK